MKVAIRDATLFGAGYQSLSEACDDLAVPGVELTLERNMRVARAQGKSREDTVSIGSPIAQSDYQKECKFRNVQPAALLLSTRFGPRDNEEEIEWCVRAVGAAAALEMKVIRLDSYLAGDRGLSTQDRVQLYAGAVQKILERTEGSAVGLAMENHGPVGNDVQFLRGVLEAVPTPRFGLTLDVGNLYWSGKPLGEVYALIHELAPRTLHTHMKNIKYPPDEREKVREMGWQYAVFCCPIYEGDIDIKRAAKCLNDAGYRGALCLEDESLPRYPVETRKTNLQRSAAHLLSLTLPGALAR